MQQVMTVKHVPRQRQQPLIRLRAFVHNGLLQIHIQRAVKMPRNASQRRDGAGM